MIDSLVFRSCISVDTLCIRIIKDTHTYTYLHALITFLPAFWKRIGVNDIGIFHSWWDIKTTPMVVNRS